MKAAAILVLALILAGFTGFVGGMAAAPAPIKPPNHPPLYFWGPGNLSGVQGSGQVSALDYAPVSTRPSAANQAIHSGSIYCSGVTTGAFVPVVSNDQVELLGQIGIALINVTSYKIVINAKIGTTAPSTSFGSGACASGASFPSVAYLPVANTTMVFPFSGSAAKASGTYYAWIDIQAQGGQADAKISFNLIINGVSTSTLRLLDVSNAKAPSQGSPAFGTWPVFPSAYTEAPVTQAIRLPVFLQSQTTKARLTVRIVASAVYGSIIDTSAFIWAEYSTDSGSTWANLCGGTNGGGDGTMTPRIDVTQAPSITPYSSSFCTIATGAYQSTGILLRIVGDGGDDVTTFRSSLILLELSP